MNIRWIDLEGCVHFRDLGGHGAADGRRVRHGLVYRSGSLHTLTPTDVRYLQDELGIATVLDLRSHSELAATGPGPLVDAGLPHYHVSLFDWPSEAETDAVDSAHGPPADFAQGLSLGQKYYLLAEFAAPKLAHCLALIAQTNAPLVFHCAAGKDRTGILAAILLALLGVSEAQIVEDYAESRRRLEQIRRSLQREPGYERMLRLLPPDTLHAEPETMVEFLKQLQGVHRSIERYAEAGGLEGSALARLRSRLMTAPEGS